MPTKQLFPDGSTIRLVTTPYLIASKLEAFYSRGQGDYSSSHDLEDTLIVLDGRRECLEEIRDAPDDVKSYLADTFKAWLNDADFQDFYFGTFASRRWQVKLERLSF